MNSYHLWPQSSQRSAKRRALQPITCCYSHSPGKTHDLLLPLPNAPGAAYICLRVTAASQGPATRSSLHHLPVDPCYCQGPSNLALAASPAHCLHLSGSTCTPYQGDNSLHTLRKETPSIKTLMPKINSKASQATQGC